MADETPPDPAQPVQSAPPVHLQIVDADAETRLLIETLLRRHTGRQYIVESVASGKGLEAQLAVAVADRERLEKQVYLAQKMETVGQLAGGIAHDFNNILTAIVGFGTLVAEQVSDNEPASRNAAEILAAANRASALTRQLLAFGRRQVLHPARLDLNETVNALAGMLCQLIGENIDLRIVCAPGVPSIRADQSQLESALANLVINARDAMPRGGTLTIETSEVVLDEDYCSAHVGVRAGRYARLSVSDTGVGMSQDLQAHIFEPFFTTKEPGKGSGLGLATVYGIVKQSGGYIWVYSEPGHGTTFKVYLPLDTSEGPVVTHVDPPAVQWSKGNETVLLVEDAPVIRRLARQVMSRAGYTVMEAADAGQALSLVGQHAGALDLLVTDLIMPGPSGIDLAEQLKTIREDVRVLFMSGYTDNAIVRNGLLADGAAFPAETVHARAASARKMRQVLDTEPI